MNNKGITPQEIKGLSSVNGKVDFYWKVDLSDIKRNSKTSLTGLEQLNNG